MRYGAPEEAWRHFADRLDLTEHLLPVVSNPNAAIAERSTMKSLGKTPSVYDRNREVVGLGKWTAFHASPTDVDRWSREPDYGMCIQARAVRAIDIDVPDPDQADAIEQMIVTVLDGIVLPARRRANSGKRLLAFRYEPEMTKRVVPVEGGIVEFLGDGQQFIAAGTHDSGFPYAWDCAAGLPALIPVLTDAELHAVWSTLVALFATGEPTIARAKREGSGAVFDGALTDSFGQWLVEHWEVYDTGPDGELYLRCPFEDDHTSDSGITSTAYFMAGTGGYERGHMKCLHAHCAARSDHDFQAKTGYIGSGFTALPERVAAQPIAGAQRRLLPRYHLPEIDVTDLTLPDLTRDGKGRIEATSDNINRLLLRPDITQTRLALDMFKEEIVWCDWLDPVGEEGWQRFTDADYTRIKIVLERIGAKSVGKEMLRDAVHFAAAQNEFDSAQEWLSRQVWDGVPRVATFFPRYLGTADTPYTRAVSRYLWTAFAGRVIRPGCQADMVPILYGSQGTRKTSAVKAMAPSVETYTDVNLTERDDNLSRRLRGRLVCELEELRGLRSRDAEAIKAWITKTHEDWVPKFKEFATIYPRRFIQIGTTNEQAMLADDTGERRWLPTEVATHGPIDVDAIRRDCAQLWAEGAALYGIDGVQWADAEAQARDVHVDYKIDDPWVPIVERWLRQPADVTGSRTNGEVDGGLSPADVLTAALGIPARDVDHGRKMRIGKVMKACGYWQDKFGKNRDRRWVPGPAPIAE